ncbi:hypothetical protein HDU87_002156 [Geranomyces variabilis]|uniref:Uncharacterized protein n=1 Tax=Geranomyces variabilis TaxID=109894 RepID=A0AAD5XRI7_9FUNG|nr:hypothetical protein HDU87_002156 [Geranomyces variabilis]
MSKSVPDPLTTTSTAETNEWAPAPPLSSSLSTATQRTLKRKPHRLSATIAGDCSEFLKNTTATAAPLAATTADLGVGAPEQQPLETEEESNTTLRKDLTMFVDARYSFDDEDQHGEEGMKLATAVAKLEEEQRLENHQHQQQFANRTLRRSTNRNSSSSSSGSSTTSWATMEDARRKFLIDGHYRGRPVEQQHAGGFAHHYSDDEDKESMYSLSSSTTPSKRISSTTSASGGGAPPPLLPSLASHRALTSAVLRFDRLQSQNLILRSHLAAECDALDAADETYAARLHELGLLRFERKFLAEVVALASAPSTPKRRGRLLGINADDDEDAKRANRRRTLPPPRPRTDGGGALYSSLPTLALNLETEMDLHVHAAPGVVAAADHHRRWSLSTAPAASALSTSTPFASTDPTLVSSSLSPSSASSDDDWSSRPLQRSAFTAMSAAIREAISTKIPHPPSPTSESPATSSLTTATATLLATQTTHLERLCHALAHTNAELRAALDDLRVGPLPAYACWIRDLEAQIAVVGEATRALREERRMRVGGVASQRGDAEEGVNDWDHDHEDDDDDGQDVFYDCEEGDEKDFC